MIKISLSNIFITEGSFAGLCENVNNFSEAEYLRTTT